MVLNVRQLLILDTGPLRELLSFVAVTKLGYAKLRSELKHLNHEQRYRRYSTFVAQFKRKTTTGGVVVELGQWIRKTDSAGQLHLWEELHNEFRRMGMDEYSVSLLNMSVSDVAKYGPADVSLIHCARENAAIRPVVLTIDQGLWSACRTVPVEAVTLQEITAESH